MTRALAAFVRSIASMRSPWDRYYFDRDETAISASATRGEMLFHSRHLSCFTCHGGMHFSDAMSARRGAPAAFHNPGLYNLTGGLSYPVAVTDPYMHDSTGTGDCPHSRRGQTSRQLAAVLGVLALVAGFSSAASAQRPPVIAAASDLNFALGELARQFEVDTGQRVDVVFGSSGTLMRQVQDGAPFEMFLSADEAFVDRLATAGLTRDRGVLYAVGRLVLFAPPGSPLDPRLGLDGLAQLLATDRVPRFAIANPGHAPYGRAAEAALRTRGLWTRLQPRLVLGENVSQAAQFATTGNAVGGIIAYSLALAPNLQGRGTYALIPEGDHPPLRQRMVLLKRASPVVERFYAFLQAPSARAAFERYGFTLPK